MADASAGWDGCMLEQGGCNAANIFLHRCGFRNGSSNFCPNDFVRLTDLARTADRGPTASSGLAGFNDDNGMGSAQILLSRLQLQEVAVSRASQHLDDARSKLAEVQVVIRSETAEIKHFEDAPNSGDNGPQVEAALNRAKSDLEASTNLAQQRQLTETDAEQQLRTEQDKLSRLESLLDELVEKIGHPSEQPSRLPR